MTGWTISTIDMRTAGTKKVTVTYTEGGITKTSEFNITVNNPTAPAGMVFVPAGTTSLENGNISVSQSFFMNKYEVTQAEWQSVMSGNSNNISEDPSYYLGYPSNPVERVKWYDVLVFCNRKSMQEGITPVYIIKGTSNPDTWGVVPTDYIDLIWDAVIVDTSSKGYRLPTEIEWEYAARGGSSGNTTIYPGSDIIENVAWYQGNSGTIAYPTGTTHPVGTKQPNELDIYDMSGNVYEWCWDKNGNYRILRGSYFYGDAVSCKIYFRNDNTYPGGGGLSTGFRVVRTF